MIDPASITLSIKAFDPNDKALSDYFHIRFQEYTKNGMDYYVDGPDKTDMHPDTRFIIMTDSEGNPLGGRRILIHRPGSGSKLKTEENITPTIAQMLPHLDTENRLYVELTSLCLSSKVQGNGLYQQIYEKTFDYLKNELKSDFILSEVVPKNLKRFLNACQTHGCTQLHPMRDMLLNASDAPAMAITDEKVYSLNDPQSVEQARLSIAQQFEKASDDMFTIGVRLRDQQPGQPAKDYYLVRATSNDGDRDFRTLASFKSEEEVPLLSPAMKRAGIGQPLSSVELTALVESREQLKQSRRVL